MKNVRGGGEYEVKHNEKIMSVIAINEKFDKSTCREILPTSK